MLIKLVKHNLDAIFACLTALKVHFCLSVSACICLLIGFLFCLYYLKHLTLYFNGAGKTKD